MNYFLQIRHLTFDLSLKDVDELLSTDMTLTFDLPLEDVDELLPTVISM